MPSQFVPGLADGSPSLFLWKLRTSKSRTNSWLARKVDGELWESFGM
jgi:hypothetical protein